MQIKLTNAAFLFRKWLLMLMMKTFVLLCSVAVFSFTPIDLVSQNSKIKIHENQTLTVDQIFDMIMNQTDYNFIYEVGLFKDFPLVEVKKGVITTNKLLQRSLSFKDMDIVVTKDNTIIVKEKPVKNNLQQELIVTGKVTDGLLPISGASIIVKNTTAGTFSDQNGYYSLKANSGDVLVFSYLGYKTIEVTVTNQMVINIILEEDTTQLKEIVLNAGYYSVKDKERTGSLSKITSKEIEQQPVSNFIATIQGKMPGVNIIQESGIAGGGFKINIRGINSLREGANSPLYIIDGVPYSTDPISDMQTSTSIPGNGNPLASLNPADIASIDVLKDADATAIYGSRGANGVVLVTTKKGTRGKTSFTLSSSHAVGTVTKMMDLMDTEQYVTMRREAFANDGITSYPANTYDINGTWAQDRYTDWQEVLLGGTSKIRTMQATATGGSSQNRYLISGNYRNETSVFPGDFLYTKGGARVSFDHISDDKKFKVAFTGGYTVQDNDLPWIDFVTLSRQLAPNAPHLYDNQGSLNWENSTWVNPLSNLESKNLSHTTDLITNSTLIYNFNKELAIKTSFGFTSLNHKDSRSMPSTQYDPAYNLGSQYSSVYINNFARDSWIIEPQITWESNFGRSKISLLAGATLQSQNSEKLIVLATGFSSNSLLYDLASASETLVFGNNDVAYKYQAFFGRANYNYSDRLFLNFTARRDGSSRFGPGKQFSTFGALGMAWLFNEQGFFKEYGKWLSFGKLRGSYGITGNDQIGDYQFLNTYTSSGYQYAGVNGLQPSRLYNSDFSWETNRKLELALELGFLKDRINLTAAWYKNRSSNQLVGLPLPGTTGFPSIQTNLNATIENTGFEATLSTINFKGDNFSWSTSANITAATNKLVSFPGLKASTYRSLYVVGKPTTIVKLFEYTGVDLQTGLYTFKDVDGDGTISSQNDRETVRDFNPNFYGGIQNHLSYKNLHLDVSFQFVKQENFNFSNTQRYPGILSNQPSAYSDRWQTNGDVAPYQRFATSSNQQARQASEFFAFSTGAVSDASFIRLKNVSISYDLSRKLTGSLGCRLTLQGHNLLTITSFKGADPEFTQGGTLPPLRIISGGIQLTY